MEFKFTKETLKSVTIDNIIEYCQENNQIDWLKACASEPYKMPIYPTITVVGKDGTMKEKADKKADPIRYETVNKPFTNIKAEFITKFFPELVAVKKQKKEKETMWDRIAKL
jgi:hypothetical protein